MDNSYIKLYRKSLTNQWLQNGDLWCFWCYCLLKASYKAREVFVGDRRELLQPGQFIFGRHKAAEELKMSEQKIRTAMQKLIKWGNLTSRSTNKYSVLTVVNWELYQGNGEESTSKSTNDQPAGNQQATTNNKVNKIKEKEILGVELEQSFNDVRSEYPQKADKKKSHIKWFKIKPNAQTVQAMKQWIVEDKSLRANYGAQGKFYPEWKLFATWLHGECWNDPHYGEATSQSSGESYCSKHNKFFPLHSKCPEFP